MKNVFYITIIIFVLVSSLYADELTVLKKEYNLLKKNRELLETSYWEKKYKYLSEREKGKNEIEKIYSDITHLLSKKNFLRDEVFTIEKDISNASEKKLILEQRKRELFGVYEKLYEKLKVIIKNHIPLTRPTDLILLEKIKNNIDRNKKIIATGREIFELNNIIRKRNSEILLYRENIVTEDGRTIAGYKFRFGSIFFGYRSDTGIEGVLARNGKITGKIYSWFENTPSTGLKDLILTDEKGDDDLMFSLYMDVLQSPASGKVMSDDNSLFSDFIIWFKSGKIIMYALLAIFLLVIGILVERLIFFFIKLDFSESDKGLKTFLITFMSGFITPRKPIEILCKEIRERSNGDYKIAERIMEEFIIKEVAPIERNLNTIKSMGALAPLLGLLGTVTGMISLFEVITAFGTGDPRILAGGISEALVTTEFGLIVAIPSMFFFRMLRNRADYYISCMETRGLEQINILVKEGDTGDSVGN